MDSRWLSLRRLARCFLALGVFSVAAVGAVSPEALVEACRQGRLEETQRLLAAGASVNALSADDRSPLMMAVAGRHTDLAALLLRQGADPSALARCLEPDCDGHPPLSLAIAHNDISMVRLLLDAKADLTWKDHLLTRRANEEKHLEIYQMLKAAGGHEWQTPPIGHSTTLAPFSQVPAGLSLLPPAGEGTALLPPGTRRLRLAILATQELLAAADLLQAELARVPVDLVERNELGRVLAEQHLTADSAADPAHAARLGQLVGADLLALVRKVDLGGSAVTELRLVRVSPGVVLDSAYRPWNAQELAAWSRDAAARIGSQLGKALTSHAVAVSPVHFTPLTERADEHMLARDAALLATGRLVRQPGVVVLERSALGALAQEQLLAGQGEFWSGAYVLDGTAEVPLAHLQEILLTLRLRPAQAAGREIVLRAQGPHGELPALVGQLVAQMQAALSLREAPASTPVEEAQRYFEEASAAHRTGLYYHAFRASETVAALGLKTPEFQELRLCTAVDLLLWQASLLTQGQVTDVMYAGWGEDWVTWRLGTTEWLRPDEFLETGRETVILWREALCAALERRDEAAARRLFGLGESVKGASLLARGLMSGAVGELEHHEQRAAIFREWEQAFDQGLEIAGRQQLPWAETRLARANADLALFLYPSAPALTEALSRLLHHRFISPESGALANIVGSIVAYPSQRLTLRAFFTDPTSRGRLLQIPWGVNPGPAARPALQKLLAAGSSAEERLGSETLRFLTATSLSEAEAASGNAFALLLQHRENFVAHPGALPLFFDICDAASSRGLGAPKFNGDPSQPRRAPYGPELLAYRRELFLALSRQPSAESSAAFRLYDADYHPPGEDLAQMAQMRQNALARLSGYPVPTTPITPPPVPVDDHVAADYRSAPPLLVERAWTLEKALGQKKHGCQVLDGGFAGFDDRFWLMVEPRRWDAIERAPFVAEVSFPSLETYRWPLPETLLPKEGTPEGASLMGDAGHVYLARSHSYFAIGDRATRRWEIHPEVSPSTPLISVGDALFFGVETGEARGLVRYSKKTRQLEQLASNRRAPALTPLDNPSAKILEMTLQDDDHLLVDSIAEVTRSGRKGLEGVTCRYTLSTGRWDVPSDEERGRRWRGAPLPLRHPGEAYVAYSQTAPGYLLLQLPDAATPRVVLPLKLRLQEKDFALTGRDPISWYWQPAGYVALAHYSGTFWFVSADQMAAYLRTHPAVPAKLTPLLTEFHSFKMQFQ